MVSDSGNEEAPKQLTMAMQHPYCIELHCRGGMLVGIFMGGNLFS